MCKYKIHLDCSLKSKIGYLDFIFHQHLFLKEILQFDYHWIVGSQIYLVSFVPKVTNMAVGSRRFGYLGPYYPRGGNIQKLNMAITDLALAT